MQKKRIITYLCNALLLICITACHQTTPKTGEMSAEDAIELLDARIRKDAKNHTLLFNRAQLYMQTGRVNEAIADLTQAVKLKSNKIEYQLLLADAYFANGDVEHSYETLDQALKTDPQNQEAILKQGEIAFYSRDYDRALTSLSTVTAKDPNNRTALFMKSFIYKEKGDTTNAILLLRKVCDIYPDYAPAFEELGVLYAYHHDPLAAEYLKTAIRLDPTNTNAYYAMALFYQETGQLQGAEDYYKQLLDIDANNKDAWHNRGYIELYYNHNAQTAIAHFNRALQCDSLYYEALINRGNAYKKIGNNTLAEADFQKAESIQN